MSSLNTISNLKDCVSSMFTTCSEVPGASARAESAHAPKALSLIRKAVAAVALAGTIGAVAPTANAIAVHGTNESYQLNAGRVDFGGGLHAAGTPTGLIGAPANAPASQILSATVKWDYSPVNGQLVASARVRGVMFWDAISPDTGQLLPGFAQAEIVFNRLDGTPLITIRPPALSAPGGNANAAANQQLVDLTRSSSLIHSVTVKLFEVRPDGIRILRGAKTSVAPRQSVHNVIINNDETDFGDGVHAAGTPTSPGRVVFTRTNGSMSAQITGRTYWDSLFASGTVRLICEARRADGTLIATAPPIDRTGPGNNANNAGNQRAVNVPLTNGSLWTVRLRVGEVAANGQFVGVANRSFSFE